MRSAAIIGISCAVAATALLLDVQRGRRPRFDVRVHASLRGRGPRKLRQIAAVIAKPEAVLLEAAAFALLTSRRPRVAMAVAGAPALALSVSWVVKKAFTRARPLGHLFQRDGLSSFPSGHTAGTTALWWTLASACPKSHPVRVVATVLAAAQTALVASARITGSNHWPTDTIAGAALGLAASEAFCLLTREPDGVAKRGSPEAAAVV